MKYHISGHPTGFIRGIRPSSTYLEPSPFSGNSFGTSFFAKRSRRHVFFEYTSLSLLERHVESAATRSSALCFKIRRYLSVPSDHNNQNKDHALPECVCMDHPDLTLVQWKMQPWENESCANKKTEEKKWGQVVCLLSAAVAARADGGDHECIASLRAHVPLLPISHIL